MGKLLYRVDEAAELLSISVRQVYDLVKEGKLKGHNPNGPRKKGLRIPADSLRDYANMHRPDIEVV